MLHELGHYLYGLGDEYKGCQRDITKPASIMEYSFGNNVRYKRKGETREYKVMKGFDDFWEDLNNRNYDLIIDPDKDKNINVVTHFCHNTARHLLHISGTGSEHDNKYGKSCWQVMLMNQKVMINDVERQNYTLEDPFEKSGKLKLKYDTSPGSKN
jgi:hypothetical protein